MNAAETGKIIQKRRKEKGLTQKELAAALSVETKTISKWETGRGYPDISALPALSEILSLDIAKLLKGDVEKKRRDSGNLKRLSFYICPECGNILFSTSSASIFCCINELAPLSITEERIPAKVSLIDDSYFIEIDHPMSKENHILFAALEKDDTLILKRLYPEGPAELYMPRTIRGTLYIASSSGKLTKYRLSDRGGEITLK